MRVEPIRNMKDINAIRKILADKPRDLLLFNIGINSGIRVCDLLKLKVNDVKDCKINDRIVITESKTGKTNVIIINKIVYNSIRNYLDNHKVMYEDEYLFKSRKGVNYPLTTYAVTMYVKKWCKEINLTNINVGAHSLRKTHAYLMRKKFGVSWELICKRLNHSNPAITRRYIGVQDDEVEEMLKNEI